MFPAALSGSRLLKPPALPGDIYFAESIGSVLATPGQLEEGEHEPRGRARSVYHAIGDHTGPGMNTGTKKHIFER